MSYRWSLLLAPVLALVAFAAWSTPRAAQAQNLNCANFPSQAAAQDNLIANPSDPNGLDGDNDGVACQNNPGPFNRTPVNRSGAAPAAAPRPATPGQASALPSTGTGLVADTTLPATWTLGGMALLLAVAGGAAFARRPR